MPPRFAETLWSLAFTFISLVMVVPSTPKAGERPTPWVAVAFDNQAIAASGKRPSPAGEIGQLSSKRSRKYMSVTHQGHAFQIGAPWQWSVWTRGLAPDDVLGAIAMVDEVLKMGYARHVQIADQGGATPLAALLVNIEKNKLVRVEVTVVGRIDDAALAVWIDNPEGIYESDANHKITQQKWFDHLGQTSLKVHWSYPGHSIESIDYMLPDMANRILWRVQCLFPVSISTDYVDICDQIRSTFATGPS